MSNLELLIAIRALAFRVARVILSKLLKRAVEQVKLIESIQLEFETEPREHL